MRCCFIPFVRDLNGKKTPRPVETSTGAESLHRDSFQRGFQDRKETNSKNSSQQKWNVLKIIQKSARLQTSLGTQIEIFVKPPPSHTRVKTLLALRFATSRVNPMSSFSRAIMRLDLQIGAATSSGDDC